MASWPQMWYHEEQAELWACQAKMVFACASRGAGKCIVEGSLVTMADGTIRPIEKVLPNELVVSVDHHLRQEPARVLGVADNGKKPTLIVRLSGRELPLTGNHPILVNGNRWVDVGDVRVNDLVAVPRSIPHFGPEAMDVDELDFLAMWLAEGRQYYVSNQTPVIVERLHEIASSWELTPTSDDGCMWYLTAGKQRGSHVGTQNRARRLLEQLGLWSCDSKTKFIPECIFKLPREQLARFLSMFYGCDGYCCPKGEKGGRVGHTIGVGLANRLMVRQLSALLLKFGIRGCFTHKHHKARSRRTGRRFHSWRLETVCSDGIIRFAEEIGMFGKEPAIQRAHAAAKATTRPNCSDLLPITEQEFTDHVVIRRRYITPHNARIRGASPELLHALSGWHNSGQYTSRMSQTLFSKIRKYTDGTFDDLADGDVVWERVVSIKDGGERQTYDLEVEGNHNFIVEGAVVHNSECAKRKLAMSLAIKKPWDDPRYFYAAPTYRQVKRVVWNDMLRLVPKSWIAPHGISHSELTIRTIFGSELILFGLDSPQRMEGVQYDGGVIDESSDVDHGMANRAILPALTWRDGWLWKIGVPKRFGIGAYDFKTEFLRAMKERELAKREGRPPAEAAFMWPAEGIVPQARLDYYAARMDPADYDEQFGARWLEIGGGVYHSFSMAEDGTGNVRPCQYQPELPIRVGMDFNVNPGTMTLGHKVEQHFEVFDEFHLVNTNTAAMLNALWNRYKEHKSGFWFYGDATGRANKSSAASSDYTQIFNDARFRMAGRTINWQRANPPRTDRFACTNALILNGRGERNLWIDPRCVHLIDDMAHRQYKHGSRELPTNEGLVGHHADSCLVGETPVVTDQGLYPIEQIPAGAMVLTRSGYRRVLWSGLTNPEASVLRLWIEGGMLEGTASHPVYGDGDFRSLGSFRSGHTVSALDSVPCPTHNISYTMDENTPNVQTDTTNQLSEIIKSFCIETFGAIHTGLYRMVMSSITEAMISPITAQRTWSVYFAEIIRSITGEQPLLLAGNDNASIGLEHEQRRLIGMGQRTDSHGINNKLLLFNEIVTRLQKYARSVVVSFNARTRIDDGVQRSALTKPGPICPITGKQERALSVISPLKPDAQIGLNVVPLRVLHVAHGKRRRPVYNMKVEGQPEFFAGESQQCLVHNCDYIIWRVFPMRLNVQEMPEISISRPTSGMQPLGQQHYGQRQFGQQQHRDPRIPRYLQRSALEGE